MEQEVARPLRTALRYALPVAAIPGGVVMLRRMFCARRGVQNEDRMLLRASKLDVQGAMSAAVKHISGVPIKVGLTEEHGMPVWHVEIVPRKGGPTREVRIDGKTGDLLEMKPEFLEPDE